MAKALIRYIDKMGRRPLAAIGIMGMLVGLTWMPQGAWVQWQPRQSRSDSVLQLTAELGFRLADITMAEATIS